MLRPHPTAGEAQQRGNHRQWGDDDEQLVPGELAGMREHPANLRTGRTVPAPGTVMASRRD